MKIKVKKKTFEEVLSLPVKKRQKPIRQSRILKLLVAILSFFELRKVKFKYNCFGMEKLDKKQPCLILMNHSSFLDLKIAFRIFRKRRFNIVSTEDTFIGKKTLMRFLGCTSTLKFLPDTMLVRDMMYIINKLNCSVLMYPEACYTFDGTATTMPEKSLGKCLKLLKVPLVIVETKGAFHYDPLYNGLQLRKVDVSADVTYVLSPEEIAQKSVDELNDIIKKYFSFDNFKWQQENKIKISEPFRADGLNRVLYKCPHCLKEGMMVGKGTTLKCEHCNTEYELTEYGFLKNLNGESKFSHVPDWYKWERECVKQEVLNDSYMLDTEVDIYMVVDSKCFYKVGDGRLTHTKADGFNLVGCEGKLNYNQKPGSLYCLNSDFFFYEIGDVIGIGDQTARYYCFPKNCKDVVCKARLAQEEIYKIYNS